MSTASLLIGSLFLVAFAFLGVVLAAALRVRKTLLIGAILNIMIVLLLYLPNIARNEVAPVAMAAAGLIGMLAFTVGVLVGTGIRNWSA